MPGRRLSRGVASLVVIAAALCTCSAWAGAATVTVGDPLTQALDGGYLGNNGSTVTVANTTLQEPDGHVASPVNGTIVSWRAVTTGTGEYALRVLRPATAGQYTGAGRSPENISVAGDHTFSANLPIHTGDLIGLDLPDNQGISGRSLGVPDGVWSFWELPMGVGALPEGTTAAPFDSFTHSQLAFNATVEYTETPSGPGTGGGGGGGAAAPSKKCKKKKKNKRSAESAKKKCKKKKKH
jgi:hypothetical protein